MKKTYLEDGIAAPIQAEASEKPGILLIGDSIRMGYCETVRRELLEETGYSVIPQRLSGIYERISEGRDEGLCHKNICICGKYEDHLRFSLINN